MGFGFWVGVGVRVRVGEGAGVIVGQARPGCVGAGVGSYFAGLCWLMLGCHMQRCVSTVGTAGTAVQIPISRNVETQLV